MNTARTALGVAVFFAVVACLTVSLLLPGEWETAVPVSSVAAEVGRLVVLEMASGLVGVPQVWCIDVSSSTSPRGSIWVTSDSPPLTPPTTIGTHWSWK